MPWIPLPKLAYAICKYPFTATTRADLSLQIGDEVYIFEKDVKSGEWCRGYLMIPPSLLAGLTSNTGQVLEKRVFTGVFPLACVKVLEEIEIAPIHLESRPLEPSETDDSVEPFVGDIQNGERSGDVAGRNDIAGYDEQRNDHGAGYHQRESRTAVQKPLAPMPMLKIGDDTISGREEPLVDEIASCLREWHASNLHQILLSSDYQKLGELSFLASRLDFARRQLLHNILTRHELRMVHECAIWDLVQGNKLLSGDVIVRSPESSGRLLTDEDSAIELSRLQSEMSLLDSPPKPPADSKMLHHVYADLKSLLMATELTERAMKISLCLYRKVGKSKVTLLCEPYAVDLSSVAPGIVEKFNGNAKALFSDIDVQEPTEIDEERVRFFFVLRFVTLGAFNSTTTLSSTSSNANTNHKSQLSSTTNAWRSATVKGARKSMMWSSQMRRESSNVRGSVQQRPSPGTQTIDFSDKRPRTGETGPNKVEKPVKRLSMLGVVEITNHIRDLRDYETRMDIRSLASSNMNASVPDAIWSEIAADIAPGATAKSQLGSVTGEATITLKAFKNPNSTLLVQTTPTILHDIHVTPRIGFPGTAPVQPRSDIYLTLLSPIIPDNAFLAHPRYGSAPISHDIGMANLQLTLEVRNASGARISECVYPSSNSGGHTAWRTTAIDRGDSWGQTLRLAIHPDDVPGSHVVMSLADGFSFPFALCWMPLWTQGAFMRDGEHSLVLYKYDDATSSLSSGKGAYLTLPWSSKSKDEDVTGPLASLLLDTHLCSTKYSQDPDLLGLLKWRERSSHEVSSILQKFNYIPELEIIKLLNEVLDSLFEILVEFSGNDEFEDLVFNALVVVLGIIQDRRFNLQAIFEEYIRFRFRWPFAFPCLVRGFLRLTQDPSNSEVSRKLRALSKVGNHVLKFIIIARQQQIAKEVGIGIKSHPPTFSKDLSSIFNALTDLMQSPSPVLVGTKTLVVQNFHDLIPELIDVLTPTELLNTAVTFVNSCSDVQGKLVLHKLVLIRNLSATGLSSMQETAPAWLVNVGRWLDPYWGDQDPLAPQYRDQVRLCCSIISTLHQLSESKTSSWLPKLVESYLTIKRSSRPSSSSFSMLFPTTYPFPSKTTTSTAIYDEALLEIFALIATIFSQSSNPYPELSSGKLLTFLSDLLRTCHSILSLDAFPKTWLSIHIFHHCSVLKVLDSVFSILKDNFLPHPDDANDFNTDLWKSYLFCLIKLLSSDALTLESFSEQKRRAVWKIGGDVRELGSNLLEKSWEALGWEPSPEDSSKYGLNKMGGYQVPYVPGFVGPILELCLSVHDGLRHVSTEILYSMMMSEWALSQDLTMIQAEIIYGLDGLYKEKPLVDGVPRKDFLVELLDKFESVDHGHDVGLRDGITELLSAIDELLELLAAVYATESGGDAIQILETLRLLDYLKDMQKDDIYIGYVHKLARIQADANNQTEAGLALKLHADLYDWDSNKILPAVKDPTFPSQTAFERKERLYFLMITQFEDGQAWHSVLETYSELAAQYQHNVFEFSKLARAQRSMATIYERIARGDIERPRYFRVHYRGLGFPTNLMDKQFIFEGSAKDRLSSFTDRLRQQYPSAHIGAPSDDLEGQYLSVSPVSVQKDFLHPVNRKLRTPHSIKDYFMHGRSNIFYHSSRRQASNSDVKDQSQNKIIYTTAESFPTILRRSEVIDTETVTLTPVQIGLERTSRKTQDLRGLAEAFQENGESALQPLTDFLMILVNGSSTGSVAGYWGLVERSANSTEGQEQVNSTSHEIESDPLIEVLKVALIDHVLVIQRYLKLYTRSAHQAVKAELTKDLEMTFDPVLHAIKDAFPPPSNEPPVVIHNRVPSAPSNKPHHQANGSIGTVSTLPGAQESQFKNDIQDTSGSTNKTERISSASRPEQASRLSQIKEFGKAQSNNRVSMSGIGGNQALVAKNVGFHSIQARVGSVTKRLSSLNVGGRSGGKKEKDRQASDSSKVLEE